MSDIIRLVLATVFMVLGVGSFFFAVIGVFRFHYVLNRMHASAIADTLGFLCIMTALALYGAPLAYLPKLGLLVVFQWIGSPAASHFVGRLETEDKHDESHYRILNECKKREEEHHTDGTH